MYRSAVRFIKTVNLFLYRQLLYFSVVKSVLVAKDKVLFHYKLGIGITCSAFLVLLVVASILLSLSIVSSLAAGVIIRFGFIRNWHMVCTVEIY